MLTFVRVCACSETTCICKFVNSFSALLTVLCLHGHIGMSVFYCHYHWRGRWERCTFFRQTKHCLLLFGIISNPFRLTANFVICVVIYILAGISCLRFPWAQIKRLPSLWCLRWLYWRNPRAQHDHWMYSHPQNCHSGGKRGLHSKGVW